ncbi:hypothetical protein Csa_023782 [Cucumis sativus]|nr:hypothetical protein Csa_023782 [Cucumis sativus]
MVTAAETLVGSWFIVFHTFFPTSQRERMQQRLLKSNKEEGRDNMERKMEIRQRERGEEGWV